MIGGVMRSFNRTFMELKDWETRPLAYEHASFNRTFMELKVHVIKIIIKSNVEFQSHLYGIERTTNLRAREGSRVSIAPLWN